MSLERRQVRIVARNGLVHEGEVITTGHEVERAPPEQRQVLITWWRGPNAGVTGWTSWELVERWLR